MRWCVFYVDGERFDNTNGDPEDAPGGGVLAVAQEDPDVGVLIHQQTDFYVFGEEFGGWVGMDAFGLTQHLMRPGLKVIKLGEAMSTGRYKEMVQAIRDDPCLPHKSARYPWEARA